jgi:catechol 2,3-dioxygenase-like lactoylglutathione lyase family enzyme
MTANTAPAGARMLHTMLRVHDLEKSLAFYTGALGMKLLREAGFSDVRVYWDTSDDNDVERYRPRSRADNQAGWIAYLVAVR